jgi:hypothetical protein
MHIRKQQTIPDNIRLPKKTCMSWSDPCLNLSMCDKITFSLSSAWGHQNTNPGNMEFQQKKAVHGRVEDDKT